MQNGRVWAVPSGCAECCRKVSRRSVMPAFETWSQENLAKFAAEAYAKMQEQQERIEQLQNELKDAIKAYRELNK
jgi:protein-arginine kinase activator protein McsA